jgi:hypothetical protein
MRHVLALFACALVACGSQSAASDRYGREVADRFQSDCLRAASSPKGAEVLKKLCSCTAKKIRSSVHSGDPQDIVESKIEAARRICLQKAYPHGI